MYMLNVSANAFQFSFLHLVSISFLLSLTTSARSFACWLRVIRTVFSLRTESSGKFCWTNEAPLSTQTWGCVRCSSINSAEFQKSDEINSCFWRRKTSAAPARVCAFGIKISWVKTEGLTLIVEVNEHKLSLELFRCRMSGLNVSEIVGERKPSWKPEVWPAGVLFVIMTSVLVWNLWPEGGCQVRSVGSNLFSESSGCDVTRSSDSSLVPATRLWTALSALPAHGSSSKLVGGTVTFELWQKTTGSVFYRRLLTG